MSEVRRFKYQREDFGELPVNLHHLRIYINFLEDRVEVRNLLDMSSRFECRFLELDADDLEILSVEWIERLPEIDGASGVQLDYSYLRERKKLVLKLPEVVSSGRRFCLRTLTNCFPSDHILEGIYRDSTPPGAPQQYMSQCQQWGFQRIMPIFDDCRAKCTMTTTIEADAAYTHLISNGNISLTANPEGKPKPKPGDPTRQIITYENPIPMAPYLFLVCAGTWDTLVDEITYDSGRKVRLEYLVPPGAVEGARIPMEILKESILWIRKTQDYEYTGDAYRTICMEKSNFGGMENVGNTTIVTDAALISEHTLDAFIVYAHAIIVHEFEHNQCGSETTMETPFDVWLNEAFTVDVERQFLADVFDPTFVRLNQVDSIRNPLLGPLAMEDAGHVGRIVREGFNHPDELIDSVTYVKAAEVIRMLRLIVGQEAFKAGKTIYFSRYRFGNANSDQFFECFEEAAGVSLKDFKERWLYSVGYPKVTVKAGYDAKSQEYRLEFRQENLNKNGPFHLPIELALVDDHGKEIPGTTRVYQLKDEAGELIFSDISKPPAFASINRDYSFYGTLTQEDVGREVLIRQLRLDPNWYNRVDAMRRLTDCERIRLLEEPDAPIDPVWLDVFGQVLDDDFLPTAVKAYLLRIDEQPLERSYCTWYPELAAARERLMREVNKRYRAKLVEKFHQLDTYFIPPQASPRYGIEERLLKQVLLDLIIVDDLEESHDLALRHFRKATTANDRVSALLAINRSSAKWRLDLLEEVYEAWHSHLTGYANYLRVVSSGTQPDVFRMIEREKNRPTFDIKHPTWARALFLPMALNNKVLWSQRGINWVTDSVIELAPINAITASRLLNTFQHVKSLKPALREQVLAGLEKILSEVSDEVNATIHRQASAYLGTAPSN